MLSLSFRRSIRTFAARLIPAVHTSGVVGFSSAATTPPMMPSIAVRAPVYRKKFDPETEKGMSIPYVRIACFIPW
jgi:hypothetical protein